MPLIWLGFPHTFIHVADALEQLGNAILFHRVFCLFLGLFFASLTHLRHLCLHEMGPSTSCHGNRVDGCGGSVLSEAQHSGA